MKTEKLPRRERERLRQRGEMLLTALTLFSEKGYHNVSMQEIAEKAEFAIGTLYKFFQNKEDLYKAIVVEESEKIQQALTRALEQPGDEIGKLRNYVRNKGELFHQNLPFIRLYLAENRGISFVIKAGADDLIRKGYYALLEKLASVMRSGIKSGQFRPIADPYRLAVALDSTVNAFLLLWLEQPERHPFPEDPNAILSIFLEGLAAP